MISGVVKIGLQLAGVPSSLVSEIEAEIPGAERLLAAAKLLEPTLNALLPIAEEASPHIDALIPLVVKAWPLVESLIEPARAMYPEVVALLPTAQKVLAFVDGKPPVWSKKST